MSRHFQEIQLKELQPIDEETGIESYPGFLGMTWDGQLSILQDELKSLESINWRQFSEAIDERQDSSIVLVVQGSPDLEITINAYADIAYVLDQIPSIDVQKDDGNPDGGMASGTGFIFFVKDGFSKEEVKSHVDELVAEIRKIVAA